MTARPIRSTSAASDTELATHVIPFIPLKG